MIHTKMYTIQPLRQLVLDYLEGVDHVLAREAYSFFLLLEALKEPASPISKTGDSFAPPDLLARLELVHPLVPCRKEHQGEVPNSSSFLPFSTS